MKYYCYKFIFFAFLFFITLITKNSYADVMVSPSYGDFVWNDVNKDGIFNIGESGLDNVTVHLYKDMGDGINDPANDSLAFTTITLTGGQYLASGLIPGKDYYAVVYLPPTYYLSPANVGLDNFDSEATLSTFNGYQVGILPITRVNDNQAQLTWDIGLYQDDKSAIGNYVWFDKNQDGMQTESSSLGLNGIKVFLYDATSPTNPIDSTITANDQNNNPGYYLFNYLEPGSYFLEFELPSTTGLVSGTAIFPAASGTSNGISDISDSDVNPATSRTETFSVVANQYDDTWDAGIFLPTGTLSLGNQTWIDTNADGLLSGTEVGKNGIKLYLYIDNDNNGILDPTIDTYYTYTTTFTQSTILGRYNFLQLPEGNYIVQVAPSNFLPGKPLYNYTTTLGSTDPDNDINLDDNGYQLQGVGLVTHAITLTNNNEPNNDGDTNKNTNLSLDIGFYPRCSLMIIQNIQTCNDNNTPANHTDDYFLITLNAINLTPGSDNQYQIQFNGVTLNPPGSNYGSGYIVGTPGQFSADGFSTYNISIVDKNLQEACIETFTTTPVTNCSVVCNPPTCLPVNIQKN